MINIAFCDDDITYIRNIARESKLFLNSLNVLSHIQIFQNGYDLIERFKDYNSYFHIVIIDINMPLINGKEVAKELRLLNNDFKLIFLSSCEYEVFNIFQYKVSDFIPKNLISKKFKPSLKRIVDEVENDINVIKVLSVVNEHNHIIELKIPLGDIIYIDKINQNIYLHTERNLFPLHGYQISKLIEEYNDYGFVSIHRACTVNMKYIDMVTNTEIHLRGGEYLPISRRKKKNILEQFTK